MAATEHVEGRVSVAAALAARQRDVHLVLLRHGTHAEKLEEVLALAAERGVPIRWVAAEELNAMAHGASHGGVVAICSAKPRMNARQLVSAVRDARGPALLLLLEGVDDARNLGFTLRSAEAFGADAVMIKKHLWDFDAVEVARPSSGAYERMPLAQVDDVAVLRELQRLGVQVLGCIAGARRAIHDADLTRPTVLAVGGEKRGLSGAVRSICDGLVTIPTRGGPSSLALSHAAAVVLAEAFRQRSRSAPTSPDVDSI